MAYVYRHIRHDKNEPFYIGIGSDKYYKRAKNKTHRNPIWKRIAAKTTFDVEILFDELPLDKAKEKEKEFIAMYGRIDNRDGILANLSAGGDGMFQVSIGVKERLSKINSGSGNSFYGKKHTMETRKYISEIQIGKKKKPMSDITKRKIGDKHKGKPTWNKGGTDPIGAAKRTGINHSSYKGRVECYNFDAVLIHVFESIRDAAIYFNTKTNNIRRVIVGDRNHHKGKIFKYEAKGKVL